MPVRVSGQGRASVLQADHFCQSYRKIQEHVAKSGIIVSYRTFYRIIAAKESGGKSWPARKENTTNPGLPIVRTPVLFKKVTCDVKTLNPLSQHDLFWKHGIDKGTVPAISKMYLRLNFKKEVRTQVLLPY